jgi:hypothetical protein
MSAFDRVAAALQPNESTMGGRRKKDASCSL